MKYGLIGERLSHSYSKIIHGLLGNKEYELLEISRDRLPEFLASQEFLGLNVTIPYKRDVMAYCELSDEARRIGSVNTIIRKNGKLFGYNTDYGGFSYLARRTGLSFYGKKVLILGGGGTAGTARCVAADSGAYPIITVSRKGEDHYGNIHRHHDANILINTTPVGMYPDNEGHPVDIEGFDRLEGVLDVIYNPLKTKLILYAEQRGIACAGGLAMLTAQAVYGHRLFFGLDISLQEEDKRIEEIFAKITRMVGNVVLVGMPGCGKSTIGGALASKMGAVFADTDEEITLKTGLSPAQIIQEQGEQYFRQIEKEVIRDLAKKTGQVIATGGGSVTELQNRVAMKQNGYVIYLDREISRLATNGRPLSSGTDALRRLYEAREPLYRALCDLHITAEGNPEDMAAHIMEKMT